MSRLALFQAATIALIMTSSANASEHTANGKRLALLIGVNHYDNRNLADLSYAERDVEELSNTLKSDYQVQLLLGSAAEPAERATRANIEQALERLLGSGLTKNDAVLIAISGHGQQLTVRPDGQKRDEPFFCPRDAVPGDAATMLNLSQLIERLGERGGGSNLLLVDACRNDPDQSRGRGIDGDLVYGLPKGMAVFFSCSYGEKAQDSAKAGGGHGLFFHFFLEGLRNEALRSAKGDLTWERLVPYVKDRMNEEASKLLGAGVPVQTPHEVANLGRSPLLLGAYKGLMRKSYRKVGRLLHEKWTYRNREAEGYFRNTLGKDWIEIGSRGDKSFKFYFKEVKRNQQYVEIYDSSRLITVRLYSNKSLIKHESEVDWRTLHEGTWETAVSTK
jgi:hypothetical protein